uniref:kelch-like protein 12 n=1 Tax=Styela clava TaxID=7725 RepID=UPI001939D26D|nr:kelch-like protein 12 [Styela clava]
MASMENLLKIDKKDHAYEVLRNLNSYRKEKKHCDFLIKAGSEEIPAHRNVLSACSDYFRGMLSHETKENESGVVTIKKADPTCVKRCINFIYTGEASVEGVAHADLMHVAHLMQLQRLCDGVTLSLEEELNAESFFLTKQIANTFFIKHLEEVCERYAQENFRLISLEDGFKYLEKDYVSFLIKSKSTQASESAKCKALIIWASVDLESRSKCFEDVLGHLDLLKIPLGYRRYLVEKEPLVFLSNPCLKAFLISIMDKANVFAKDFTIQDDGISNAISVFDKATRAVQVFEPEQRRWTRMQNIPDEIVNKQFTAVQLGGHIYILMTDKTGHRLNYSDRAATWTRVADRTHTSKVEAVVVDGSIFAFDSTGNGSKAVERLDLSDGSWTHVTDREQPCHEIFVVSAQGLIYCGGGFNGNVLSHFFSYDPISSNWATLTSMPTARRGAAAAEINGRIYAMGGNGLRSVECFDIEGQSWTTISNMNHPRYFFSACVLGEKIFVVGGQQSNETIEVLDPYENAWNIAETMTGKNIHAEAGVAVNMFT